MLLVIPVSRADRKFIPLVTKAFELFPPGSGHKLLVVGSPNSAQDVRELSQKLCIHFAGNASTYIFETDSNLGWPTACNYFFQQAAFYVRSILASDAPWFWFELDSTPLRADWLDEIESACIAAQTRLQRDNKRLLYFGVRERSCIESQGALLPIEEAGEHMAACGVYPGDMVSRVLTLPTVSATNIPWYTFIRWYVVPQMHAMPLIQNNWQTCGYERQADGRITCQSEANWAWDIHFNKDVRTDAVFLHGCKDGSLIDLLAAECDLLKKEGMPVVNYWTDWQPEAPAPAPAAQAKAGTPPSIASAPTIASKRRLPTNAQIQDARERINKLHAHRKAGGRLAALQAQLNEPNS